MNLKKITRTLSKIRKNVRDHGDISEQDEDILRQLLGEELGKFFDGTSENDNDPTCSTMPPLPEALNDNSDLTKDQQYRLKLLEKSDSTSFAVH